MRAKTATRQQVIEQVRGYGIPYLIRGTGDETYLAETLRTEAARGLVAWLEERGIEASEAADLDGEGRPTGQSWVYLRETGVPTVHS